MTNEDMYNIILMKDKRIKELIKENQELRIQLVNLKNKRIIFVDTEEDYKIKVKERK